MKEIPKNSVLMVPITHPEHAKVFEQYKMQWHAVPAISSFVLEIGGLEYPCCPFNGWYMSTEIANRNLTDPYRYDIRQSLAKDCGLNINTNASLWQEKVQTILNEAVLYSYSRNKVSLVDQYSASESFMTHYKRELKERGFIPCDWIWLVPPTAGGMVEVFHQEMVNFFIPPGYKTRNMNLIELYERNPSYKFDIKESEHQQENYVQRVKPFIYLYYASETGTAERFYD